MFEVEMKFRVGDLDALERQLAKFGVVFGSEIEELDLFYRHPSRDFAATDEALRIRRRVAIGEPEQCFLTYKGPKIDSETKTRREIEIPLTGVAGWDEVLRALGFSPRGAVRKFRRSGELLFEDRRFGILSDRIPALEGCSSGSLFVELETLAEEEEMPEARNALLGLAASLGLSGSIRTSYLGLLRENEEP